MAARVWRRINEGFVRRGEILLDQSILDGWDSDLERMNTGKEGKQYVHPDVLIRLLGYTHVLFHVAYRQTEGLLKALRRFDSRIQAPDYSTIDRRENKLAVDLANRGDWIRWKWKVKHGSIQQCKLSVLCNDGLTRHCTARSYQYPYYSC